MYQIGMGINIGGGYVLSGGGGSSPIATIAAMNAAQIADFLALHDSAASGTEYAMTNGLRMEGDSTLESVRDSADVSDRRDPAVRMNEFTTASVVNYADGGDTLAMILADMQGSPQNTEYNLNWILQGGINSSTNLSQNLADWDALDALITHNRVAWVGPHAHDASSLGTEAGIVTRLQYKHIQENALGTIWQRWVFMADLAHGLGSVTSADRDRIAAGAFPSDAIGIDNIHPSTPFYEPSAVHMAQIGRALDNSDYPYTQSTYLTVSADMSAGDAVGNLAAIGTISSVTITAGNDDDLIAISNAGAVTRGSGALDLDDFRKVFYSYSGAGGETQHGVLRLGRWDSTDHGPGMAFDSSTGGYTGKTEVVAETTGFYPEFSCMIYARHDVTDRARELIGSARMRQQTSTQTSGSVINVHNDGNAGMRMRILMYDSVGGLTGNRVSPNAPNSTDYAWYSFSFRQSTGELILGTNGSTNSYSVSTTNPASFLDGLIFGGGIYPAAADLRSIWFAPDFIDWTDSAERDRFFDSSTLAAVDIGTGVVNGITPDVYLHGGPGGAVGWVPPCNDHGTLDLVGTPWVDHTLTDIKAP